jgi:glucose 1-dehydrogenase
MNKLEGKVAVITGASRGLGKAIALLFAREGARVVFSARSKKEIEQNASELRSEGLEAATFACDVSDPKQVEALALFVLEQYGDLDIWVNNAGISGPYGATLDLSHEDFLGVLRTNMFGSYYGSIAALRVFLSQKKGKLINIVGAGDRKPTPRQNAYGSSKVWIRNFTLALAKEYKDSGVGIYILQPGLMDTTFLSHLVTYEPYREKLRSFMPFLIRGASNAPEIPAHKALWLASSATDGRTGLYVRVGSMLSFLVGFLGEGMRRLLHRAVPLELDITIIPSAYEPLQKNK